MIKIAKGTKIDFSKMKSGETNGKIWAYIDICDTKEGSKDKYRVFISNSEKARFYTGQGTVRCITEVTKKAKKNENGTWETTIVTMVEVEGRNGNLSESDQAATVMAQEMGFMELPDTDDAELPFQ